MWVKFIRDFDFSPPELRGHVAIAYKAGAVASVTRLCAERALAAKAAEPHILAKGGADGEDADGSRSAQS